MQRTIFAPEHDEFRKVVADFFSKELAPCQDAFIEAGHVSRDFALKMGELGLLGIQVPEEYGGGGSEDTFLYNVIVNEEAIRAGGGTGALGTHTNIVLPYIVKYGTEQQKRDWLPGMASGEILTSIAMTEPGTGSDLAGITTTAVRDGDEFILNGAKTFITGGILADLVLVVARTTPYDPNNRRAGLSLLAVDVNLPGFSKGKNLNKMGIRAQDTAELFFDDVRVPVSSLLGEEGKAFEYLGHNLPQERLVIAIGAVTGARYALELAKEYANERKVFGKGLKEFQNTKFVLAECSTEVEAAQMMLDAAIAMHEKQELSPADAARVKLFTTEMQARVVDKCLQIHGGYGYIMEYPIARLYTDARVSRIYGGTSEVMKTIIAKDIGL